MEKLCRQFAGFHKPTKKELLEFCDTLIKNRNPYYDREILELIGKLWMYLEPSLIFRNDEEWIKSAVGTNEKRPHAFHPFVSDGSLIGTDGHRIHIVKVQNMKDGFYHKVTLLPIQWPHEFVKYREILPPLEPDAKLITLGDFEFTGKNRMTYCGVAFQRRYLIPAFSQNICLRAPRKLDTFSPLRLDSLDGNRTALIACTR